MSVGTIILEHQNVAAERCWIHRFCSFYVQKMSVVDDLKCLTYFVWFYQYWGFDSFEVESDQDWPYWCDISIYSSSLIITFVEVMQHTAQILLVEPSSMPQTSAPPNVLHYMHDVVLYKSWYRCSDGISIFDININKNINMWHKYCMLCDIK